MHADIARQRKSAKVSANTRPIGKRVTKSKAPVLPASPPLLSPRVHDPLTRPAGHKLPDVFVYNDEAGSELPPIPTPPNASSEGAVDEGGSQSGLLIGDASELTLAVADPKVVRDPPQLGDSRWFSPEDRFLALCQIHNSITGHCGYESLYKEANKCSPSYPLPLLEYSRRAKDHESRRPIYIRLPHVRQERKGKCFTSSTTSSTGGSSLA